MPRLSANSYDISTSVSRIAVSRGSTNLCHCVLHNLLVRHIALVTHEKLVHALRSVAVNLLQPLLHVVETIHIGDIVDDADAVSTAVVG